MNHCVPDFEAEYEDTSSSAAAVALLHKAAAFPEEDMFELLWRNGPVAQPLLDDRLRERSPPEIPVAIQPLHVWAAEEAAVRQLFIEEDEMASWLHYQIGEDGEGGGGGELYGQLFGSSLESGQIPADQEAVDDRTQTPAQERFRAASQGVLASGESAVVGSNVTPRVLEPLERGLVLRPPSAAIGERAARARADERKRKARDDGDSRCQSEDAEFRSGDKRKCARRSASTRRTRAAEVHNLSERRRRDRINEKMKALQELIPRCNKSDKASMLDEAIEYLKSLQLQVQMMSMRCNMGPVMIPGVQTYLPPMGMGMGAGGLGHPMLQFGHVLPCCPIVGGPTSRPHLAPRPLMPSFQPPNIAIADQSRVRASNVQDPASNPVSMLGPNMMQIPNVADRYHAGIHQLQNQTNQQGS